MKAVGQTHPGLGELALDVGIRRLDLVLADLGGKLAVLAAIASDRWWS